MSGPEASNVSKPIFEGLQPITGGSSYRAEIGIALRHLASKKSETMVSIVTFLSIIGVLFAVAIVHVVMGVMTGFEEDLREKILGANTHIVVQSQALDPSSYGMIANYDEAVEWIEQVEGITAASPFIYTEMLIRTSAKYKGVVVKGIDPVRTVNVTDLSEDLIEGPEGIFGEDEKAERDALILSLSKDFPSAGPSTETGPKTPKIIVGNELAKMLSVTVGDTAQLWNPTGQERGPYGMPVPQIREYVVAGIFRSGMTQYDSTWTYVENSEIQQLLKLGDRVNAIEIKLDDLYRAPAITRELNEMFATKPPPSRYYNARHWQEMNKALFEALALEKAVSGLVLFASVALAGLLIVNTLIMVVLTKGREIAILKALGASSMGILRIFIIEGTTIGIVGTTLGTCLGFVACLFLKWYGFPLDTNVYLLSKLPVVIDPASFAFVAVASMLICFVATIYPAWRASKLNPVEGLRYE